MMNDRTGPQKEMAEGQGHSSVVQHVLSMFMSLDSMGAGGGEGGREEGEREREQARKKFHWYKVMLIHLHIVYGCLCVAEPSSCLRL